MSIILQHPFAAQTDLTILLIGTNSLEEYLKKLRAYAKSKRSTKLEKIDKCDVELKCIGDGFELFGEMFLKFQGTADNRIWVKDFKYLTVKDNGVDAEGTCSNSNRRVFIQFKCYQKHQVLTGLELDTFVAESSMLQRVQFNNDQIPIIPARLIVITSSSGINDYTAKEKYRGEVECFSYKELIRLVEAPIFWDAFREAAYI